MRYWLMTASNDSRGHNVHTKVKRWEGWLAHFRDVIWVLSSTAAITLQPSTRRSLPARLRSSKPSGVKARCVTLAVNAVGKSPCKVQCWLCGSAARACVQAGGGMHRGDCVLGWRAHLNDVSPVAGGISLLRTIVSSTPTPLPSRLSSVTLLSRNEASGIPQKSVIEVCSSTALASWSAPSPVIELKAILRTQGPKTALLAADGIRLEATVSLCKVQWGSASPEARQLRFRQNLGQLEDARHVFAFVGQRICIEAASAVERSCKTVTG